MTQLNYKLPISKKGKETKETINELKDLYEQLVEIDQQTMKKEAHLKLLKELSGVTLLHSTDVKLRQCLSLVLVEIMRIFAPEPPFETSNLKKVFEFLLEELCYLIKLAALTKKTSSQEESIKEGMKLMTSFVDLKAIIILVKIIKSEKTIEDYIEMIFLAVENENISEILYKKIAELVSTIIYDEEYDPSIKTIKRIMESITKKEETTKKKKLIKTMLNSNNTKIDKNILRYVTLALLKIKNSINNKTLFTYTGSSKKKEEEIEQNIMFEDEGYYQSVEKYSMDEYSRLVGRIYINIPSIQLSINSNIIEEMISDSDKTIRTTGIKIANIVVEKKIDRIKTIGEKIIERAFDRNNVVRDKAMLFCYLLIKNNGYYSVELKTIEKIKRIVHGRIIDHEASIRLKSVELGRLLLLLEDDCKLGEAVLGRCRDVDELVRQNAIKTAFEVLLTNTDQHKLFNQILSCIYTNDLLTIQEIYSQIVRMFGRYEGDEQYLQNFKDLVNSLSDEKTYQLFMGLIYRHHTVATLIKKILEVNVKEEQNKVYEKIIHGLLKKYFYNTKDIVKEVEYVKNNKDLKEIVLNMMRADNSYDEYLDLKNKLCSIKAIENLVMNLSPILFHNHVHALVTEGDNGSQIKTVIDISKINPHLVIQSFETLCDQLISNNSHINLKIIANLLTKTNTDLTITKLNIAKLNQCVVICKAILNNTSTDVKTAKCASAVVIKAASSNDPHSLQKHLDSILTLNDSENIINNLAFISVLAKYSIATFELFSHQIIELVLSIIMDNNETFMHIAQPEILQLKKLAIKTLKNRSISLHNDTLKVSLARPTITMLMQLITLNGQITKNTQVDPSTEQKDAIKKLSIDSLLKIISLEKYEEMISNTEYINIGLVVQAEKYEIREYMVSKLVTLITKNKITNPSRYYAILLLTAFEPESQIIQIVKSVFSKIKSYNILVLTQYYIYLLAHHPDYGTSNDELDMYVKYIKYFIDLVVDQNNCGAVYSVATEILYHNDSTDTENKSIHTISELIQYCMQAKKNSNKWTLFPHNVSLIQKLYSQETTRNRQKTINDQYVDRVNRLLSSRHTNSVYSSNNKKENVVQDNNQTSIKRKLSQ